MQSVVLGLTPAEVNNLIYLMEDYRKLRGIMPAESKVSTKSVTAVHDPLFSKLRFFSSAVKSGGARFLPHVYQAKEPV